MDFLKKNWFKILLLLAIIFTTIFLVQMNNGKNEQVYRVAKHDVEQIVLLSGQVRAVGQVDLSFEGAGKIDSMEVSQGDLVKKNQLLVKLDYGILKADLLQAKGKVQSAQSSVSLAQASVKKAEANISLVRAQNRGTDSSISGLEISLSNTTQEQATLVKNAYSDLLNNDLTAYPVDSNQNVPMPIVSGSYEGEGSGDYLLELYNSGGSTGYSARVSGLEKDTVGFDDFGIPSSIGTRGLYLALPDSGKSKSYGNTNWIVPVPNTRSTTYQTKLGSYNRALQTQTAAVASAQSKLDTSIAQQEDEMNVSITTAQEQQADAALQEARANLNQVLGSLTQAQAGVAKVQAQIENSIIRAPFDGTIARLNYKVGQSVTPGLVGITVVTNGNYELSMSIPEIDVARVHVGDSAKIILDVYGKEVSWDGILSEIELVETKIDGVPSYSSIVTVLDPDERIKIGMNARARIVTNKIEDVLAVPFSYIIRNGEVSTVLVKQNKRQVYEQVVSTGLQGTDFFIEIQDGLVEGDTVLLPVKNK